MLLKSRIVIIFATLLISFTADAIDSPTSATSQTNRAFPNVSDAFEALEDRIEDTIEHYSAFAGKIFPILSKLYISPEKAKRIVMEIQTVQEPGDWIFILLLGWATIPMIKYPYEKILIGMSPKSSKWKPRPFRKTFIFHFAEHISQAGKIACFVYGLDCLAIALDTIGFKTINHYMPSIAKGVYCLWMFSRLNTLKRFIVFKSFGVSSSADKERIENRGSFARAKIVNKILEILCAVACFSSMVDILKIKSGVTLNSLFAVSGAGTAVVALASKDVVHEVVSGLALQASDKVYEGEKVQFGDELKGCVDKIGLFETLIRDSSEMVTAVSNTDLSNKRLINISRNKFSQVKQKIHFYYEDLDRLPALLSEIRKEIVRSCPFVVTEGKPFRVYFYEYGDTSLDCIVDVKMFVTPDSTEYYESREKVLMAVGRAVKNMDAKFAILSD